MPTSSAIPPCFLPLQPSRIWLGLIFGINAVLAWAVLSELALPYYGVLVLSTWLSFRALKANGWYKGDGKQPHTVKVDSLGQLWLSFGSFDVEATMQDDCFVFPWLTLLNVMVEGRAHSVMIWPDSGNAEERKKLRVYIKWFQQHDEKKDKH